jgi:glycosyltransferase involved in cell wall biosynthesis
MRILIDTISIPRSKTGVGVYAVNLLHHVTRLAPDSQFYILAQDDDPEVDLSERSNVTMIKIPARLFRRMLLRVLFEQALLPLILKKYRIEVLHSLHYSFPLLPSRAQKVVTLHDMTPFSMPQFHWSLKGRYYRTFIRQTVLHADKLIFVSHSTERDFVARFGKPRGSTNVVHLGKSEAFRPNFDPAELLQVREKYRLVEPFVLYVGTIEPRKNLTRLVQAFALVQERHPGLQLVIAGMKGWMYDDLMETIQRLNLSSSVVFTGFIPEEDKPALIAAATVFAYPSLYEGFGIPVLEALACGTPTLTSNVSSLPEVAGDAAVSIEPTNTEDISSALERLLSDDALRTRLRDASLRQAAKFTWDKTAQGTLEAYAGALKGR